MKISKSKQELARIISENGGWPHNAELAESGRAVFFYSAMPPSINKSADDWFSAYLGQEFDIDVEKVLPNGLLAILSRDEYFHLYPAPDADGWIEWKGGAQPVKDGVKVDVKYRTSGTNIGVRAGFIGRLTEGSMRGYGAVKWSHTGDRADIISYRLHKPEQAKPEFCESVMRSIPEPDEQVWTNPPTIEQLVADYRNRKDCAERKQQEADAAKADAEDKLKALELACEALGLLVSPITEKREPELAITDWRDLQVGDVIELTGSKNPCWKEHRGREMTVKDVYPDQCDSDDRVDLLGKSGRWTIGGNTTWRFIRRP